MAAVNRSRLHQTFKEIKVHTAKCDECNKHNAASIYRCIDCGQQCCTPCWDKKGGDGKHILNAGANMTQQPIVIKAEDVKKKMPTRKRPAGSRKSGKTQKPEKPPKFEIIEDNDYDDDSEGTEGKSEMYPGHKSLKEEKVQPTIQNAGTPKSRKRKMTRDASKAEIEEANISNDDDGVSEGQKRHTTAEASKTQAHAASDDDDFHYSDTSMMNQTWKGGQPVCFKDPSWRKKHLKSKPRVSSGDVNETEDQSLQAPPKKKQKITANTKGPPLGKPAKYDGSNEVSPKDSSNDESHEKQQAKKQHAGKRKYSAITADDLEATEGRKRVRTDGTPSSTVTKASAASKQSKEDQANIDEYANYLVDFSRGALATISPSPAASPVRDGEKQNALRHYPYFQSPKSSGSPQLKPAPQALSQSPVQNGNKQPDRESAPTNAALTPPAKKPLQVPKSPNRAVAAMKLSTILSASPPPPARPRLLIQETVVSKGATSRTEQPVQMPLISNLDGTVETGEVDLTANNWVCFRRAGC
ncbi:hypothetical protein ACLMJK_007909 [Lecanora helva]